MHVSRLISLAGELALDGERLVKLLDRIPPESLTSYWAASRCRLDRWGRGLKAVSQQLSAGIRQVPPILVPLAEEILASEVLCRVFTAVVVANEHHHRCDEAGPVAINAYYGHVDARRRLEAILCLPPLDEGDVSGAARRLSECCRRWNDVLIGHLLVTGPVVNFAFDGPRAEDFAIETMHDAAVDITRQSLRQAFARLAHSPAFSPDSNEQIAQAVLSCFTLGAHPAFNSDQVPWLSRLETMASDTADWVDQLLH